MPRPQHHRPPPARPTAAQPRAPRLRASTSRPVRRRPSARPRSSPRAPPWWPVDYLTVQLASCFSSERASCDVQEEYQGTELKKTVDCVFGAPVLIRKCCLGGKNKLELRCCGILAGRLNMGINIFLLRLTIVGLCGLCHSEIVQYSVALLLCTLHCKHIRALIPI
ncbi:hypothetical protein BDA96_01G084700 [Sorghum bicolor]|uniref:Uncharacterized protein n=1 Tax=Sorghum bicolor TaxID=4558 RepID=A0A921RXF0_SORBI|nr:uncharacterized protein LOC110434957 [Sorghum bicolor]KAG0547491.1 hypothetical protein BDA96_01G084700 [Sorghum bicolor]|eukprot:XP_021315747.1 uncharacterized protein LOC110434957 [Sorghum bicolor]